MSDLVVARNCCMARMPGRAKSMKRFEWSDGLDTALNKKLPLHARFLFVCDICIVLSRILTI